MRTTVLLLLGLAACLAHAHGVQIQPRWESTGFRNPESVIYDAANHVLYVSNVNGKPTARDGNGYISRVSLEGEILERDWLTGLDAPKGMAIVGGKLYVTDIDTLVEIDIEGASVIRRHRVEGGEFFNDLAAALDGSVYLSDTTANTIYRLRDGQLQAWLMDKELNGPNGLLVQGAYLMVAGMGPMGESGKSRLFAVSLSSKSITGITGGAVGKLDGLAVSSDGDYLVTDWSAGRLMHIMRSGTVSELLDLGRGSADLCYVEEPDLLIVPMMLDNKLLAYSTRPEDGHHH